MNSLKLMADVLRDLKKKKKKEQPNKQKDPNPHPKSLTDVLL